MRQVVGTILGAVIGFGFAWVLSDSRSEPARTTQDVPVRDVPTRFRIGQVEPSVPAPALPQGTNAELGQDPFIADPPHETARRDEFESAVRTHGTSPVDPQHGASREQVLSTSVLSMVSTASRSSVDCRVDSCLVTFHYADASDAEADIAQVTADSGRFLNCHRRGLLDEFQGEKRFRLLFTCDQRF